MKKLLTIFFAAAMALTASAVRVHTLGDSLGEEKPATSIQQGWPTFLSGYFTAESGLTVINPAKSGTSAMTFYNGYWKNKAELNVQPGDYVLIGFTHNDEKLGGVDIFDYNQYLLQQGLDTLKDMRGSKPSTTFRYWMTKLVEEVRAKGAHPVLYSTVCRMYFSGNTITRAGRHDLGDSFDKCELVGGTWTYTTKNKIAATDRSMDYSYQTQLLAQELGVPFVDLTTASKNVFEQYGATNTKAVLGIPSDGTHTSMVGANLMAREMAKMLRDSIAYFADKVSLPTAVSANPTSINVGECYTEIDMINKILVQGFELGAGGTISVSAGNNLTVSFDGENYAKTISTTFTGATLMQNIYIRANYISTGEHTDNVTVTVGSTQLTIPVTASTVSLEGGTTAVVEWPLQSDTHADAEGGLVAGFEMPQLSINQYKVLDANKYDKTLARFRPTQDNKWPAGEIDQVDGRYVGFSVTAPADKEVLIENISFVVGAAATNSIRYRARYSKDATFGENTILCENLKMISNTEDTLSLNPVIRLEAGETLYIRFYPWASEELTTKYFCMRNMRIRAQVFGGEPELEVEPGNFTAGFGLDIANIATEFDTLRSNLPEGFVVTRTTTASDNWTGKDVCYGDATKLYPVKAYRNGSNGQYDEMTTYFGFTVTIPEGKYLLIDSISADWAYQKNAASYKFLVTKLGVDFYESPEHSMTNPTGGSPLSYMVNTTGQALLQKLTGTVEVKMPFWIASSAAYVSLLKFQIHARVAHDKEVSTGVPQSSVLNPQSSKLLRDGQIVIVRGNREYDLLGHVVR